MKSDALLIVVVLMGWGMLIGAFTLESDMAAVQSVASLLNIE